MNPAMIARGLGMAPPIAYLPSAAGDTPSPAALFKPVDESADHLGDYVKPLFQSDRSQVANQPSAPCDLAHRNVLSHRPAGYTKEVSPVSLGEAAVAFGDVGRDGGGSAVELINEETVAALESLSMGANLVGKVQRLRVDHEAEESPLIVQSVRFVAPTQRFPSTSRP
jgi:hypothetical protein